MLGAFGMLVTLSEQADVTSRCEVDLNGRAGGSSAGGADIAADLAISWRFEACRAGAPGADNRQWKRGESFF